MSRKNDQTNFFRGIYEFEDPSGTLLAARVPHEGSADLYDGTVVVVRPSQCCVFVHKGKIAELFADGTHELNTGNIPVLTKLSNLKLGFKSPIRCELWFFSGNVFAARRWGTPRPIVHHFQDAGPIPVRAYGQFNLVAKDPHKLLLTLVGSRHAYDITEAEQLVQGQIAECFPEAIQDISRIEELGRSNDKVSERLEHLVNEKIGRFGLRVIDLQVFAVTPPDEVLKAMNEKAAMSVIGNTREYLMYQAAASLGKPGSGHGSDQLQMMMGLMLGKGLLAGTEEAPSIAYSGKADSCPKCAHRVGSEDKFCANCGAKR